MLIALDCAPSSRSTARRGLSRRSLPWRALIGPPSSPPLLTLPRPLPSSTPPLGLPRRLRQAVKPAARAARGWAHQLRSEQKRAQASQRVSQGAASKGEQERRAGQERARALSTAPSEQESRQSSAAVGGHRRSNSFSGSLLQSQASSRASTCSSAAGDTFALAVRRNSAAGEGRHADHREPDGAARI